MSNDLTEQLKTLIVSCMAPLSVDLIDAQTKRRNNTVMIHIVADRPKGGITIGECGIINKSVKQAMDSQEMFNGDYVVEVSSPGLDRPLKTIRDFKRTIGRKVRVHLSEKVQEKKEHHGTIAEVNERQITIHSKTKPVTIPLEHIVMAVQVID